MHRHGGLQQRRTDVFEFKATQGRQGLLVINLTDRRIGSTSLPFEYHCYHYHIISLYTVGFVVPRRTPSRRGHSIVLTQASAEARERLAAGKVKYESGDRMGALKLWEDVPRYGPDDQERITALYNCTCVHAGFGDVELAQITLRDAVLQGLDFKEVVANPQAYDEDAVKFVASQQVQIRLRKFTEAALKAAAAKKDAAAPRSSVRPTRKTLMQDDISEVLETDMTGIDTSIVGIVKRVIVLLVVLSLLGVGLWFVGLHYLFPDTQL